MSVVVPGPVALSGSVSDDGLPVGGAVSVAWSVVSGPGVVTFADAGLAVTSASFDAVGSYVLRLAASDGELSGSDTVTVTVTDGGGWHGDDGGGAGGRGQ